MKTIYKILMICAYGIVMFTIGFFVADKMCPAPVFDKPVVEDWRPIVEKISVWQNGKEITIDSEESGYTEIGRILLPTLHKLNLQAKCVFGEERIQEIKRKNKVIEIVFRQASDFPISQWIQEEERYHIPTDENGYRILENLKSAIFVLEDNLGEGMEGHILVGSEREDRDERCSRELTQEDLEKLGPCEAFLAGYLWSEDSGCYKVEGCRHIPEVTFGGKEECELACSNRMWGCWAIKQEDGQELDKSWIEEINKILPSERSEEFCGLSTYAKCKTDADCNMGGCGGQVCEGKGEGTITDCLARDCYYVAGYKCKCSDDRCQWIK